MLNSVKRIYLVGEDWVSEGRTSMDLSLLSLERFEKGGTIEEPLTAFKE